MSPREKSIALAVALGYPHATLLHGYGLTPVAVREHLQRMGTKLGAHTGRGAELVFLATRHQEIPLLPAPTSQLSSAPRTFLRLLAEGTAGPVLAKEMDLTLPEADCVGKLLLAEFHARTYSHAVYLGASLLLDTHRRHGRGGATPRCAPPPYGR